MGSSKNDTATQESAEAAGLPKISQSEIDKAKKEGVLDAAREDAKDAFRYSRDNLGAEGGGPLYPGSSDIMQFAPILDMGIDALKDRIAVGSDNPIPEEKVYGLLALERNGQNRTEYVQAMMKRLDLKADELPGGGPGYTNDTTAITEL